MRLDAPVLDVSWGHDSSHIVFCSGPDLFIIDLRQQRTSKKWSPHSSKQTSKETTLSPFRCNLESGVVTGGIGGVVWRR